MHFPETREIWSYGSGYGGNALLGKKCFALRIASVIARDEGWLAEHMLVLKITSPEGRVKYIAAAFPSACGKTNLAMLIPTVPGWTVETIGDDIAWMKFGDEGRLHAINPEFGFFGVAPGTNESSNPNALHTMDANTVFTNTALTDDGDVWWEDLTDDPPAHLTDWKGQSWTPDVRRPRPRTRTRASACRRRSARRSRPSGRTRRACRSRRSSSAAAAPPRCRSCSSRTRGSTACSSPRPWARRRRPPPPAALGELRRDPFAMLPFCGYNMGDYFAHWMSMAERTDEASLPGDLRRQLVPQGRRRRVPLARLRRELPRARVDLPPARR